MAATARLAALRAGTEAIDADVDVEPASAPDRALPAKVTLGAALLALIVGS